MNATLAEMVTELHDLHTAHGLNLTVEQVRKINYLESEHNRSEEFSARESLSYFPREFQVEDVETGYPMVSWTDGEGIPRAAKIMPDGHLNYR